MPPNKPRKPPKSKSPKTRTAKGAASRVKRGKKTPVKSPGTRDVFKRRVTTYDLTPAEKVQLEALAAQAGVSVSEMVAIAVRACIAGADRLRRLVDDAGGTENLSDEALGKAAREIGEQAQQVLPPALVEHVVKRAGEILTQAERSISAGMEALAAAGTPGAPRDPEPSAADGAARDLAEGATY